MTVRKIAAYCGFSRVTFYKLVRRGVVTAQPRGRYDLRTVVRNIVADWQRIRSGDGDFENANALAQARTELTRARIEALAFKNACRRREFIRAAEARREYGHLIAMAREIMLALPGSAAHECGGMSSSAEIKRVLARHIQAALDALTQPVSWDRQLGNGDDWQSR